MIIPRKKLILAPPLAPCFDAVCDLSHLKTPQPPQAIDYFAPSEVEFCEVGTLSHHIQLTEAGTFIFPDILRPLAPIFQTSLDYFFSVASNPEGVRCRMVVSEFTNIPPQGFARPMMRPGHPSIGQTHIDQPLEDLRRGLGDPRNVTDHWFHIFSWSSALPTLFAPSEVPMVEDDTINTALGKIYGHTIQSPQTFSPGQIILHNGAVPHSVAQNTADKVISRLWVSMVLYRPLVNGP